MATKLSEQAKAMGLYVARETRGHAYGRNGNAHNPTPRYRYEARKAAGPNGLLGTCAKHGDAVDLCNAYAEDPR